MERSTSFLVHLVASHLGAADTTADLNLDTLCTNAHSVGDSHLDGATVAYTALNLTGDGISYDMSVNLRLLDLEDIDLNVFLGYLLELYLEFVNLGATLSDDEARTCGIDWYSDELESPLNDDS